MWSPGAFGHYRIDDDGFASLREHPGCIRAEDPGKLLLGDSDAAQRPQIVAVERCGAYVDRHPARFRPGRGNFRQLQSG